MKVNNNIIIENARIVFRNFSGEEGKFNRKGDRNFCVLLDHDLSEALISDGWNVRYLKPREEGDELQAFLQVKVSFANIPPKIVLVTSKRKTTMNENMINVLDWAEIKNVDLVVRPYNWDISGKTGVKGYVKSMYITIYEDEFSEKYENVPDSAVSSLIKDGD